MLSSITRSQIEKSLVSTPWDIGNKTLYDLCRTYPEHTVAGEILAKVWLIGRAYAVALERIKKKADINDDFYTDRIAPLFINSGLDQRLCALQCIDKRDDIGFLESLRLHQFLVRLIGSLESEEGYLVKRSFCSKYLHFHLPDLFYIYDSRVKDALSGFKVLVSPEISCLIDSGEVEPEYTQFAIRCRTLTLNLQAEFGVLLTPRQLDNLLINIANKKLKAKKQKDSVFKKNNYIQL